MSLQVQYSDFNELAKCSRSWLCFKIWNLAAVGGFVHFSCTLQAVPPCSAMCPRTAVAVELRLVRDSNRHHTLKCTRNHARKHKRGMCELSLSHTHTLRRLLQKSHVLQEPRRGGGETYDKLWHFYSSYKRRYCPESVRMSCTHMSDLKHRLISEITSNSDKYRNNALLFVLGAHIFCTCCREMFLLYSR